MPTLTLHPAPLKKQAIIVMSWPYKANWDLLNSLKNGCYINCESAAHPAAEATVLLFSLYKLLDYKTSASALDASRAKFAEIKVDVQSNQAILTMTTEPSFSALRKILTITAKNFTPAKLGPIYKKYMGELNLKSDMEVFNHEVDQMIKGIASGHVYATGKFAVPVGKDKMLKEIVSDIKPASTGGKSKSPTAVTATAIEYDEVKCGSRVEAFLIQSLLQTMQIESYIRNGNVVPITGSSNWKTVKGKIDSDRIKRFVELKLMKLGEKLPDVMRVICACSGYFTAGELDKLPANYTAASITAMLKKHF